MSEPTKGPEFIHVERLLEAPVIYFDAVPTAGFRGPVLSVTLALIVGEAVSKTNTENHMLTVGNLRMTAGAAEQLRDDPRQGTVGGTADTGTGKLIEIGDDLWSWVSLSQTY